MVYKNYKAELLGKYLFYSQYTVVKNSLYVIAMALRSTQKSRP